MNSTSHFTVLCSSPRVCLLCSHHMAHIPVQNSKSPPVVKALKHSLNQDRHESPGSLCAGYFRPFQISLINLQNLKRWIKISSSTLQKTQEESTFKHFLLSAKLDGKISVTPAQQQCLILGCNGSNHRFRQKLLSLIEGEACSFKFRFALYAQ